jgi:hypothetical protein
MTYQEAVAMYPHDSVFIQFDETVRPMTPAEYEDFIQRQVNAVPIITNQLPEPTTE